MARVRVNIPVRWSDMDAFGHINNVQIVRLLEETRVHMFEELRNADGESPVKAGILVARQEIDYLRQMPWSVTPLPIDVWCSRVGSASFDLQYSLLDPSGEPYAQAETTMVLFDPATGQSRVLDDVERAGLDTVRDEPIALFKERKMAKV